MTDKKSIHSFAVKWAEKFCDPNTDNKTLESNLLARDCDALGFIMDCGKAFEEQYGEAAYDTAKLKEIINDVDDTALLGSAIYSRWRYFNHWASDEAITSPENREWFITALDRLATLSES
jgi:hypothetical protein